ncbi:MAG: hypoxanthine phosphoribosyltransferase [Pirellulales bacterium]|nr:hypoxanthine phosphoribosyltransferase [Pirellulales bacterium]
MAALRPKPLFNEFDIATRVAELSEQVSHDYAKMDEIVLIGVLKGAFIFLADLSRRLTIPRKIDFIAVASYGDSTTSGAVRLLMDVRTNIEGKHVLVVEDVIDTGSTLGYLMKTLAAKRPASLKSCVFLRKNKPLTVEVEPDYLGFDIPNKWVVGYGLDYAEMFRTLPYVGEIDPGDLRTES